MIPEIENINKGIEKRVTATNPKASLLFYGLAESVAVRGDEDVTIPALVLPFGECIDVYGETDKHDITLYHRLNEISYQESENDGYGSARGLNEVADLSIIVFGKRKSVNPIGLERVVRDSIMADPNNLVVRSDFNSLQVFASEYIGVTYFMTPDFFLFKTNYRITSTPDARCKK